MTRPILLAFCASGDRERVLQAANCIPLYALFTDAAHAMAREVPRPLILLAIGGHGGAALARWVEAHGLDGVAGIGLIGVTAPWAEREAAYHAACSIPGCDHEECEVLPLGPLEPLRAVAEGARCGRQCDICGGTGDVMYSAGGRVDCGECDDTGTSHVRRVAIACAPDDGRCGVCGGRGWSYGHETDATPKAYSRDECPACSGTGKALSSADVGREFSGDADRRDRIACRSKGGPIEESWGGLTVIHYPTRADLDKHAIRAVIEILTQ